MSGTQRLPGGEPRKASQRHARRAAPLQPLISRLWRFGDRVRWRDRIGVFRRDLGDSEHGDTSQQSRTAEGPHRAPHFSLTARPASKAVPFALTPSDYWSKILYFQVTSITAHVP